jgi:hypothetical protein
VWHFLYTSGTLSERFKPIILILLAITTYRPTDGLRGSSHIDLARADTVNVLYTSKRLTKEKRKTNKCSNALMY